MADKIAELATDDMARAAVAGAGPAMRACVDKQKQAGRVQAGANLVASPLARDVICGELGIHGVERLHSVFRSKAGRSEYGLVEVKSAPVNLGRRQRSLAGQ